MENTRAEVAAIIDCIGRHENNVLTIDGKIKYKQARWPYYIAFLVVLFVSSIYKLGWCDGILMGFNGLILFGYLLIIVGNFKQIVIEAKDTWTFFINPFGVYIKNKTVHLAYDQSLLSELSRYELKSLSLVHRRLEADSKNIPQSLSMVSGLDKFGLVPGILTLVLSVSQLLMNSKFSEYNVILLILSGGVFCIYLMAFKGFEAMQRVARYEGILRFVIEDKKAA